MRAAISYLPQALLSTIVVFAAASLSFAQRTKPVPKGEYGGVGIAMSVTDAGATVQFDCALASITKQLRMKKDGSFVADGTLTRNGPGPVRRDQAPVGRTVVFKGKVNGKSLSVTMMDAKTNEQLGEYSATYGQEARLHRCY